jgi:hypothetical protein
MVLFPPPEEGEDVDAWIDAFIDALRLPDETPVDSE